MTIDTSREAVEALLAEAQVITGNPFPPMSNRDATLTGRMQDTLAALLDERDAARDASVWRDTIDEQRAYIRDLEATNRKISERSANHHDNAIKWRDRAERAEAERDALAAVIERVKAMADTDDARAWDAHQALIRLILNPHDEALTAILDTAPSDVLREHDAEVWAAAIQEARRVVQRRHGQPYETDIDLITLPNPYREKREDE